ncbi:hypothetical protein Pcinc_025745 [Petrolisthes cinctipes]|uniref:Uncharacterized protein n=1 Tax=Petrolisthes cinctipes TaxID=88211 RepID=A0AAE1F7V2_PETCI|nr:hypothetical protein Pcinc_025745 [Petrolisthes cinctipes]
MWKLRSSRRSKVDRQQQCEDTTTPVANNTEEKYESKEYSARRRENGNTMWKLGSRRSSVDRQQQCEDTTTPQEPQVLYTLPNKARCADATTGRKTINKNASIPESQQGKEMRGCRRSWIFYKRQSHTEVEEKEEGSQTEDEEEEGSQSEDEKEGGSQTEDEEEEGSQTENEEEEGSQTEEEESQMHDTRIEGHSYISPPGHSSQWKTATLRSILRMDTTKRELVGYDKKRESMKKKDMMESRQGCVQVTNSTTFILDPIRGYLRLWLRRVLSAMSFVLCLITLSVEQCWLKANQGLVSIHQCTARCGQKVLSTIVHLTPKKMFKWLMVYTCRVLPSLRNRSAVVCLVNNLPSAITKRIVIAYLRKVPVRAMRLHIMASLRDGPLRKMIDAFTRLLKLPRTLLKVTCMTLASGLEVISRVLRFSPRRNKEEVDDGRGQLSVIKRQFSLPCKLEKKQHSKCYRTYSSN